MSDSSADPGQIRPVPPRQVEMLDGNEEDIYALLENPMRKPYATDESQMLNLNQVDALNIPNTWDIIIEDSNTNTDAQDAADKKANIPDVIVRNTESSDDTIGES